MKRLLAALLAGALVLSGCSSSGPSPPTDTLFPPTTVEVVTTTTAAPVATTSTIAPVVLEEVPLADYAIPDYLILDDSFSFENFGGGEAPADLTVNMARRLYGDNQVCSDVTDNQCTPYPVILQLMSQANRSMRGGLCEGLAVLSLRLAGDLTTLAAFQNTKTVAELIREDPALLSEIAYWYVTQFAMEVQEEASAYLTMSPKDLAEVLLYDFAEAEKGNPHTGFTIGIYSDQGGHAVTPYRVEEMAGGYRIYIYDSNWPNEERWIDVSSDGQWKYALAATNPTEKTEAWSGGVGTMELTPMRSRSGPFTCSFCPQESGEKSGTMVTVAASGSKQMAIKIETESGQRLGYYDGAFVNEIPGATYRYLISGPSTADPVLVFLPPDVETFTADVEEIDVPAPAEPQSTVSPTDPLEQEQEESSTQRFSLLLLNEEKSVQIEAAIVEEVAEEEGDEGAADEQVDEQVEEQSLISFSEETVEIAEIEEATVGIAVDALVVEIELETGQQIEVAFAPQPEPEPEPEQPSVTIPGRPGITIPEPEPEPEPEPTRDFLDIAIQDDQGEVLAEVAVDMTDYRVVEQVFEEPTVTVPSRPDEPAATLPPVPEPVMVPVVIELTFDSDVGEITQEEVEVEAWVASDAEYFQAVAENRVEEVLGASYVEELEEINDWEIPELLEESQFDLSEVILAVDEDYWEDEQWEEVDYDDEWFEEQEEVFEEFFAEAMDVEEILEEVEVFMEEIEETREEFFEEHEEFTEEEFWEEYEDEYYDEEFAFQEYDAALEEEMILEEFGLDEWNDELMGPQPTEVVDWEQEDWEAYDEEMDAIWEEQMEDPEAWEEELLEEMGAEEWDEDWGPSPTEAAEWTEEDWDEYDQQWAADEEAMILEQEGLDEWPEDWGPSPTESMDWTEEDWQEFDAEQEALWEAEEESWELDTEEEWDDWQEEFWDEDAEWCDECEEGPWDDPEWDDPAQWEEEEIPEEPSEDWENWTGEDEEAWILEEEGLDEWPEEWGPPPSESWDWTEDDWQDYDEQQFFEMLEGLTDEEMGDWEEAVIDELTDSGEWTGEDEEAWILEQEGFDEWPEDWGPSPSESWEWTEEDWQAFDEEQQALWEEEWEDEEWDTTEEDDANTEEEWSEPSDEDAESDGSLSEEEEVDEEQVDEEEVPSEEVDDWEDWTGDDEEAWILEQEGLDEWPEDWGPSPSESWDWSDEDWQDWDDDQQAGDFDDEWEEWEEEEEFEDWTEEDWDNWSGEDEEAWILEQEGLDEWPEDWGPSPSESWDWTEDDWQTYDEETWGTPDEEQGCSDTDWCEEEPVNEDPVEEEPDSETEEPEVEEEPPTTTTTPPTTTVPPTTTTPPTTTLPPPTTTVPPPTTTVPSWDPYEACRGTDACSVAPGGFETWEDYDAANNPAYYDDWGTPPGGYATWVDFTVEVEAGIVPADIAEEVLPDFVLEQEIVEVYVEPVYVPTVTMTNIAVAIQETMSTSVATAQTGTTTAAEVTAATVTGTEVTATNVTGTNVTTAESGILTQNTNDGHWHLDTTTVTTTETTTATTTATTTETTTATTVTNTLVDTTTVVARTGVDFVSCTYVDNVESGCSTQRTWDDPVTTATAGDAYTEATTTSATADVVTSATADVVTTATASATVNTEEGCSEGGWRGMGDWCMVESGSRTDYDFIQVTIPEEECSPGCAVATLTIDAETNLTQAQFNAGNNVYGDPYIFLNRDDHGGDGDHSGDTDAINVGIAFASNDDGGRDCGNTCANPPSSAVDVDETPNITYCASGGACTNGVPVIDNVSDSWDSRIVINVAAADYVVRASVYNSSHDGWYRLTIDSEPYTP